MIRGFITLYVLRGLLLHLFITDAHADTVQNAQIQRQQLISKHGLYDSPEWQKRCDSVLKQLKLSAQCLLLNHNTANAYAFADGTLMINRGLLSLIKNPDQMAHIIAHEQAHWSLKHHQQLAQFIRKPPLFFPKKKLKKLRHQQELAADAWANDRLTHHRFDPRQIHHLWQQLLGQEKNHRNNDHPALADRINHQWLLSTEELQGIWSEE